MVRLELLSHGDYGVDRISDYSFKRGGNVRPVCKLGRDGRFYSTKLLKLIKKFSYIFYKING